MPKAVVFVGAMLVGMLGYELINRALADAGPRPQQRTH
jgi:hypothetical protein